MGSKKTIVAISILLGGLLAGCQTTSNLMASLSSAAGDDSFPNRWLVTPKATHEGRARIRTSGRYRKNASVLKDSVDQTVSGEQTRLRKRRPASFAFLNPETAIHPLGTIYRKPTRGFAAYYDRTATSEAASSILTDKADGIALTGTMLTTSVEVLFDGTKTALSRLNKELKSGGRFGYTSISVVAVADDIQIDVLPSHATRKLMQRIQRSPAFNNRAHYFVADKLIRARKIAYYFGPAYFDDGTLDRMRMDAALQKSPDARKVNGVYLRVYEWPEPRIVGVGYSTLPITQAGQTRGKRGLMPTAIEPMLSRSIEVSNFLGPS